MIVERAQLSGVVASGWLGGLSSSRISHGDIGWYNAHMTSVHYTPLERLLDPVVGCLTADVARRVVDLPPDPGVQARIDELAAKSGAGMLTTTERTEYEAFVEAIDVISILQAKARQVLAEQHV